MLSPALQPVTMFTHCAKATSKWPYTQIDDVLEVSSLPGQSMHLVLALRGGDAPKFQFQTNHDAIIFQTTLLQVTERLFQTMLQPVTICRVTLDTLQGPQQYEWSSVRTSCLDMPCS